MAIGNRSHTVRVILAAGAAWLAGAGAAPAQNLVTNGTFELPGIQSGDNFRYLVGGDSVFLTGWTFTYDAEQEASYVYRSDRFETTEGD